MRFKPVNAGKAATEMVIGLPIAALPVASDVSVEAFLEQIIEEIRTLFGRLAYLAALRDVECGTYKHPILTRLLPSKNLDRIVRAAHRRIFVHWLELSLRQQQGD